MIYRLDCTEKSNKCKCSMRKSRAVRPALFCKGNIYRAAGSEPQANKSFSVQQFYKNAAEVWRVAHICEANCICNKFFLLQLHLLKLTNSQFDCFYETSCKFEQGNGAIAARWQAKAGVEPPFAGCERPFFLRAGFSVRYFRCNCSPGTVARCLFADKVSQGGAVLFAPPRKAVAFLTTRSVCQKHGTGISLPAGSDQGCSP